MTWGNESRGRKRKAKQKRIAKGEAEPHELLTVRDGSELKGAHLLSAPNPKEISRYLLEKGSQDFCDAVLDGVKRHKRTELRLFAQVTRLLGVERELLLALLLRAGFQTEEEFDLAARVHRSVSGLNERDREQLAIRTLQSGFKRDKDAKERVRAQLFPPEAVEVA